VGQKGSDGFVFERFDDIAAKPLIWFSFHAVQILSLS
jgi:hypothetical protein